MQVPSGLDSGSFISIGVAIGAIAAFWRLATLLTEIKMELKKLASVPARLSHIEHHLMAFEEDINNLWAAVRRQFGGDIMSETRKTRFTPLEKD